MQHGQRFGFAQQVGPANRRDDQRVRETAEAGTPQLFAKALRICGVLHVRDRVHDVAEARALALEQGGDVHEHAVSLGVDVSTMNRLAVLVGLRYVRSVQRTKERFLWSLLYWPLYALVLHHLKRQLGLERVRYAVCAAAPASPELFEYFNALGVPLREGYGQTESTGVIALQRIERPRWGYVGEPVPGMEVKIDEDGEILTRGPGVFKGYFKDPELTASTVKDGWLHTGDVGALEDGFIKILDRKKDIIITSGGKNVTPSNIENMLMSHPLIEYALVHGDRRNFLTALISLSPDNLPTWAEANGFMGLHYEQISQLDAVKQEIEKAVSDANHHLANFETIKKFIILPKPFDIETGELTPTMKVRRRIVEQRYMQMLDEVYSEK